MATDPNSLAQDKDFLGAAPEDQIKYLAAQDPEFAKAPREDQIGYVNHLTGRPSVPGVPSPARASVNPILKAPEESGLETGPLVSSHPEENDTLSHGAGSYRALARMVHAAGQAVNPLEQIPAMFHAAVDKPQDSQQAAEEAAAEAGGAASGVPPVVSRLLYRTAVKPVANAVDDYSHGRVTPDDALANAPEALGGAAGQVVGAKTLEALPGGVSSARQSLFPTMEEAGKLFHPIEQAAKQTPIDIKAARAIAEEAKQYADAGATMPSVLKKFLDRTEPTAPASFPHPATPAPDVLYPEGRLFAQNAGRLSASERLASTPNMQRLAGKFADALKTANRDAADSIGMGKQYDQAMSAYKGAAGRAQLMQNLKEIATKAAIGAAGLGGVEYIVSKAMAKK